MVTISGVVIFLLAGLLTNDTLWRALLPAGLYLGIHLIEGETITPMLLAKRFTLNPVLVIISLVFWFWMWGAPGAILSVPMLAITKSSATGFDRLPHLDTFWRDEDYISEWIGGYPLLGLASRPSRARLEPGNDGSPASNPSIGSPFLASTSPEDLLRKCLFAWAEISLAKALLSSELFCSFLNPSTE